MSNSKKKIIITQVLVGLVVVIVLISARSAGAASWTQKSDMPTPRWNHSAAVVDGKIYVIGGLTSETSFLNGKGLATVEEYDPTTDTWTRKADIPTARGYLAKLSPVVDGKIYIIGGANPAIARVDVYNPISDMWSRGADMPTPRELLATVAWDGKIYAFGGLSTLSNLRALNTTEVYDPKTDTWVEATPMPRGVWEQSADVVDGKIYLVGGASGMNAERILQVYDPQTDTWTNATPMSLSTRGFGATVICGNIYVVGGWFNSGQRPYSSVWVHEAAANTWTETTSLPDFRAGLTTSVVNEKIYAIGGTPRPHNCQATSTVYELNLESPPPDFNGDGIINGADVSIMIDYWHMDNPLYDIAPVPCGDGIVDFQDLIVLSEHLFENIDDPTLVAHWALDEIEGDITQDSAGDNFGFVIGDPVWQPSGGQVNGAIQLDGVDDYIIVSQILNPADGPFSIMAWIKGGASGQSIISQPAGVNWLMIDAEGKLMTELAGSGRNSGLLLSQTVITDNIWHRIGFVWDGSHRTLCVDGISVAEDKQTGLGFFGSGLYIGVGKDYASGTFFSGLIDDIRVYNRVVVQ